MTIASLTAAPAAPAPKGAATPVQSATVAPDAQTATVATEAPVLSNLQTAIAAAKQSAAARQDGLSVLMANLLRAAASGNLPTPVQQAVDQLIALHLPTDVAPDAAAVKTALLTSGLFTEANLASSQGTLPADIKTTLLLLNTATASWLARGAAPAAQQPVTPPPAAAPAQPTAAQSAQPVAPAQPVPPAQPAIRAGQAVPLVVPPSPDPLRRGAPRTNEIVGAKPSAPASPQRSAAGKSSTPAEALAQTDPAAEAETIRSAIRLLGEITQVLKASGAPELPKEIKAALALASNAVALPEGPPVPQPATPQQPASLSSLPKPVEQLPASNSATSTTTGAAKPAPTPVASTPVAPSALPPQTSSLPAAPGFAPRGSSPVEQLLALQLAPPPVSSPVSDDLPAHLPAPTTASPSPSVSPETLSTPATDMGAVRALPPSLVSGQPDAAPAKSDGALATPSPQPSTPPQQPSSASAAPPSAVSPSPPSKPETLPAIPNDNKTLLTLLAKAVEVLLPRASSATPKQPDAPSQQPPAPAVQPPADISAAISTLSNAGLLPPASGGVPNDLKTLLSLFNMAADSWLPRAAPAADTTSAAATPSVPPPVRGAPSKAQPAALATLPEGADPVTAAKQLLSGSEAALARHTLLQIASLPDATPQSRDARWVFDVPLMTAQGTAVAQMVIERDGSGMSADKPTPVWRVQFAIDIEPLGPVRANLALSGDRAWVTISADRPESLDKLQSGVSWLADALQSTELDADIAFQPGQAPQPGGNASRLMDHAS